MSLITAVALKRFETLGSTTDLVLTTVLLGTLALASYIVARKLAAVNN